MVERSLTRRISYVPAGAGHAWRAAAMLDVSMKSQTPGTR